MFVSVTRLRVRKLRYMPGFFMHTTRAQRQVSRAPGFRGGSLLADRRLTFWTLTGWDDEASMRAYMTIGDHRTAMPKLIEWCDEASVAHWAQGEPTLPDWAEAERRMRVEGRPSKVRHPSPEHQALGFPPARHTAAQPIKAL